ncbi:uncharacterized protein LOC134276230 [Saccostrea cucullata]|uniref:uncharacterized protein LOC134276230 n=1 Tax=Saccostrea cuccullata TaxID=36930 RepID=UPI002ED64DFD
MELNEEDPLDVPVNKRDGLNTQQSVSDYVEAKSSTNEIEDVEVRITRMSQEMAEDFNSHAIIQSLGSKCMLPESRPKIQQYRNSRCGATEQGKVSGSGNNRSLKKRGRKIPKDSPIWQLQSMQF